MKRFTFVLILTVLIGSCDKAQDDEIESGINGGWSLKAAYVQLYNEDADLSGNKVTFDIVGRTVTFENQKGMEFVRESGTYQYSYRNGLLSFGTNRFYRYELKGDELILTYVDELEIIDDEAAFSYVREENE